MSIDGFVEYVEASVCSYISCCRCNRFSISDTACFSRCVVVKTEMGCASLNHFNLVDEDLGVGISY